MKELKDYLPLYIGCKVLVEYWNGERVTETLTPKLYYSYFAVGNGNLQINKITFFLRHISDITQEEALYLWKSELHVTPVEGEEAQYYYSEGRLRYTPKTYLYLLSKHFDLFELIEAGLALDATKLPVNQ